MTVEKAKLAAKKALIAQKVGEGYVVVHVRMDREAVIAPRYLFTDQSTAFLISPDEAHHIEVGDDRLTASLAFDGRDFSCSFPYTHIWGVTDAAGDTVLFKDEAPADVLNQMSPTGPTSVPAAPPSTVSDPRPDSSARKSKAKKAPGEAARSAPFLKRVK